MAGTPFTLMTRGIARAGNTGVGPSLVGGSEAVADFYNTINWNGIQSIINTSGNPVIDYTIIAASGTDCTQSFAAAAAPEAGTMALLGGALGGACAVSRFRRYRRQRAAVQR